MMSANLHQPDRLAINLGDGGQGWLSVLNGYHDQMNVFFPDEETMRRFALAVLRAAAKPGTTIRLAEQ